MNQRLTGLLVQTVFRPDRQMQAEISSPPVPAYRTLLHTTLPMITVSVITSQALYQLIPPGMPPESVPHPIGFGIYSIALMMVAVLSMAAASHHLAELFQGHSDFDRALRAVTLAWIPAWLGNVVATLPWPWGNGLAIVFIGYTLFLAYRFPVTLLGIRRGNRLGHYVATLIVTAFITATIGWLLVDLIPGARPEVRLGTTWLI